MSVESVNISADNPFFLSMRREGNNKERLGIKNEFPKGELSKTLFQSLGVMYMVAPYLPDKITTDFYLPEIFQELIGAMYEKEEHNFPMFCLTDPKKSKHKEPYFINENKVDNSRVALTYSGGKDSMWNMDWLSRNLLMENVLAVHFNQINRVAAPQELKATRLQQKELGFPLRVIDLLNSSKNKGRSIMRARDMFIVGVTVPVALKFGASRVFLEGSFSSKGSPRGQPFTTYEDAWDLFNNILKSSGIPIEAAWKDSNGMDTVRDIIQNRPGWISLVYNCFCPECYKGERRGKWKKTAPTFPLIKGQCGSCVKCRELNIGRIKYDPSVRKARTEDIREYILDTMRWTKGREVDLKDIVGGAFTEQLMELARQYGIA